MGYREYVLYAIYCFIQLAIMTVKTNNRIKYKYCMTLSVLSYFLLVLLTGKSYYTNANRDYILFIFVALIPICTVGYYLSKKYIELKDKYVLKNHTFEAHTPTHEDFIAELCTITICGEDFKVKGDIYSNNRDIVVTKVNDKYESVEYEEFGYNQVLVQSLFFISIGLLYIDVNKAAHIIVGAVLILVGTAQIIKEKVINDKMSLFLEIIRILCYAVALSTIILILFDKV